MITVTNRIVDQYDLRCKEFAVVLDTKLQLKWASPSVKELQLFDDYGALKIPLEAKTTWQKFLQQLEQSETGECLLSTTIFDKETTLKLSGRMDSSHQFIIITIQLLSAEIYTTSNDTTLQFLNHLRHGVVITSKNHSIVHFNQYVEKMIPKQFLQIGDNIEKLLNSEIIVADEKGPFWNKLNEEKKSTIICRTGSAWIQLTAYFDVKIQFYIYIFEDISEIMQLKEQLNHQEYLSEIGKMATTLVHEMRNPMTSIQGYFDLIRGQQGEMNSSYIKIIEDELSQLNQLCTDILFLAKPTQEDVKEVDLLTVANEVKQLMQFEANQKNIELLLTYELREKYIVAGNEMYFKQVFMNLVKNAIQSIEFGGTVKLQLIEQIHNVQLIVSDTGLGIEEQDLERIFEMFYTTKEYGTGIGLQVVKKIVDQLNGKIEVKSHRGVGTTFTISLPTIH